MADTIRDVVRQLLIGRSLAETVKRSSIRRSRTPHWASRSPRPARLSLGDLERRRRRLETGDRSLEHQLVTREVGGAGPNEEVRHRLERGEWVVWRGITACCSLTNCWDAWSPVSALADIALPVLVDGHSQVSGCLQVAAYLLFGGVVDVFDALGASARRAILDVLTERDDQTLFEICGRLAADHEVDLTRQAISQHLAVLEAAGLVRWRRDGRYKFHSIDTAPLRVVMDRWLFQENDQ